MKQLLHEDNNECPIPLADSKPAAEPVQLARARLAPAPGPGRRRAEANGLPPPGHTRQLRAIPVAWPGDPARAGRDDPAPYRPDREHEPDGHHSPVP